MGDSSEKLTKCDLALLGQVFEAEIGNRLPAQIGKSKAVTALHERGLIEPLTVKEQAGPFMMTVEGWQLTQRGHVIYCENCTEDE